MAWQRDSKDGKHYAWITDEHGSGLGENIADPASAKWCAGIYDAKGEFDEVCGYFVGLDIAIAWCLRALELGKPLEVNPDLAPTGIDLVKDSDIEEAAQIDDLDAALLPMMNLAGITDGGIAGMVFSDTLFDWETADMAAREGKLRQWVMAERH